MKAISKFARAKKGYTLTQVPTLAIVLVVIAIVLGMGATVLTNLQTTQTADTSAYNATQDGIDGLVQLASWQDIIALVIAAGIVIGIVIASLRPKDTAY